jgi:hypothetical protein
MRPLFTDGWNSFWHFVLGILSYRLLIIIPGFLAYQYILKYDDNSGIDTLEFAVGFMMYMALDRALSLLS